MLSSAIAEVYVEVVKLFCGSRCAVEGRSNRMEGVLAPAVMAC